MTAPNPFEDPERTYAVLLNTTAQYSLWPQDLPIPPGWTVAAGGMSLAAAHEFVDEQAAGNGRTEHSPTSSPSGPDLVDQLLSRAATRPEATAVVWEEPSGDLRALTYAELADRSGRLARHLVSLGIGEGRIVAVALPRGPELVIALLAVLRANGAYLPLDVDLPPDRVAWLLADAEPRLLVTVSTVTNLPPSAKPQTLFLDSPLPAENTAPVAGPDAVGSSDAVAGPGEVPAHQPAHVLYTSGSTGRPKGVVISRGAFSFALTTLVREVGITPSDRMLAATTVSFDLAGLEIFGTLLAGATIVLAGPHQAGDPGQLAAMAARGGAGIIQATPALYHGLLEKDPGMLRGAKALVGGEALSRALADRLLTAADVVMNLYGPCEATIYALKAVIVPEPGTPPIGSPLPGMKAYILDSDLSPREEGELYLSGPALANGYLGQPGLTAARFVADPAGPSGARMYRTGDLVRTRPDSLLVFEGRADDQIKLRGFRIEPGEVEAVMLRDPMVRHAVVAVHGTEHERRQLVAYAVPATDDRAPDDRAADDRVAPRESDTERLLALMRRRLPSYMVPCAVVWLDELPLSFNGKVNRRALPAPAFLPRAGGQAAGSPLESALCRLVAEVLELEYVAVDDNFLQLGGNSLLAARLIGRVAAELEAELTVRDVFAAPTVARLAQRLRSFRHAFPLTARRPRPARVPLSYGQQRLWFIEQLNGPSPAYNVPFVMEFTGPLDVPALRAALHDVVERHEALRTLLMDEDGAPYQHVVPVDEAALRLAEHAVGPAELPARLGEAARQVFKLAEDLPVRASLFRVAPGRSVLLVVAHHSASDGWSAGPLARDLMSAYAVRIAGRAPSWPPLPVTYADYSLWQRGLVEGPAMEEEEAAFWRARLDGVPGLRPIPTDRPRSPDGGGPCDRVPLNVPENVHAALLDVALRHGCTMFMVLHAALATLLTERGAGTDVVVGTVTAGRPDEALHDMVGFFVNTLVLRVDTSGGPTVSELLHRVRQADLDSFEHQKMPFEKVVEILNPQRSAARNPLFQTLLAFHPAFPRVPAPSGLRLEVTELATPVAKFDLTFTVRERHPAHAGRPGGLTGEIEYATNLFTGASTRQMADRYVEILRAFTRRP